MHLQRVSRELTPPDPLKLGGFAPQTPRCLRVSMKELFLLRNTHAPFILRDFFHRTIFFAARYHNYETGSQPRYAHGGTKAYIHENS